MARYLLRVGALVALLLYLPCCSIFPPWRQRISIASDPAGAKVTLNGEVIGTTPLVHSVSKTDDITFLIQQDGYESTTRMMSSELGWRGILDIIGGCIWLIPFLGLLSPGAYQIDDANMSVVLQPVGAKR